VYYYTEHDPNKQRKGRKRRKRGERRKAVSKQASLFCSLAPLVQKSKPASPSLSTESEAGGNPTNDKRNKTETGGNNHGMADVETQ